MKVTKSTTDCPFCRNNNLLKVAVIASARDAYLVPAFSSPGNYLIVPEAHITSVSELPDSWWSNVKQLLADVPQLPSDYNLSINIGTSAGQTVEHLHFWVIPRAAGQPSSGKGLARLIDEADKQR